MTRPRDPEHIQREIEAARTQLAGTLDELVDELFAPGGFWADRA